MSSISLAPTIAYHLLIAGAKSSLFLVGAALLTLAMRRCAAAARHLVWIGAIVGAALLPVVGAFVPAWNVPLPSTVLSTPASPAPSQIRASTDNARRASTAASRQYVPDGVQSSSAALGTVAAATSGSAREVNHSATPERASRSGLVVLALLVAWAFGSLWFLARIVLSVLSLTRIRHRATPVAGVSWERALRAVTRRDRISLLVSDDVDVPLTWGILRPIILLPREADEWSQARRELVLRHELAHVDRHDVLTQLLARVVRALHWPNPLAWHAERSLRAECEQACDDAVLAAGVRPTRYAEELLEIACALTGRGVASLAPGLVSRPSLEVRLRALLDARSTRRRATRLDAAFTGVGVVALALPLAAMRPAERTNSLKHANYANVATPIASVAPPVVAPVARVTPSAPRDIAKPSGAPPARGAASESLGTVIAQLCISDGSSHSNWTQEDHGTKSWNAHWSGRDCAVDLRAEGDIQFNDDLTDITSISRNGFFDLSVREGDELTRLVVKPAGQGELDRRYTVNGTERSWNARAQEWFADFLINLDRQTGFAVDVRFPKLLARGVPAVLDEIEKLSGDYARGLYLQRLIERGKLSPSQVRQILELAGRDMRSDYELARALIAVSDRYGLPDEDTRAVFLKAVNSLSSDYERNRALHALLSRSDVSPREAPAVLRSASALKSDYELARTLVAMTEKKLISPSLRSLYLEDVAKIGSDYERSRVLLALLGTGKLSNTEVGDVIGLASNIKSDYERARVLVAVADTYDLGDDARDAYLKAARAISSEYERGRALAALRTR